MSVRRSAIPLAGIVFASLFMGGFVPGADAAASFYQGKTLTLVSSGEAGSSYDLYSRLVASYLSKYIPGRPTIIVQNMPGANGLISESYMANIASRDGTVIADATSLIPLYQLLHPDMTKINVTIFAWIGSVTKDNYVAYVWHTAPAQTYEQAKQTQVTLGGITIGAPSVDLPVLSNALFRTKFKIIAGYQGENAIALAVQRGEVQGSFGGNYSSIRSGQSELIRNRQIRFILQAGFERAPELPDVPMFIDQAKTPEDREILDVVLAPTEFNKPFYAPPGIPAARLDILRHAFDSVVKDPGFLAAARRSNLEVREPLTGQELTVDIAKIVSTPPAIIHRIRTILGRFQQK